MLEAIANSAVFVVFCLMALVLAFGSVWRIIGVAKNSGRKYTIGRVEATNAAQARAEAYKKLHDHDIIRSEWVQNGNIVEEEED